MADPPWNFKTWSKRGRGRSADAYYDILSLEDIKAFQLPPIADDTVLFLWATDPMLDQALEVMSAWGFKYKTVGFYWAKTKDGMLFPMGTGHWTRANPEMCLLGTRGHPKRKSAGVRKLIFAPRRAHSQKPDEIYHQIERLVDGPYCELFARQHRPGWDCIGLEVDLGPGGRRWHADAREMRT